jgi:nitrogen fixation NifU-like protein
MQNELREMFEAMILDHNRNPRNLGHTPECATHHARGFNPVCNDEFAVRLKVVDGIVRDAGFEGAGCAISTASCSLMTEAVKGKSVEEAKGLIEDVRALITGGGEPGEVGKLRILAGVHAYPARIKCATLPWHTLKAALEGDKNLVSSE